MLLASAIVLFVALVATAFVARATIRRERSLRRLAALGGRHRALAAERARFAAARDDVARTPDAAAAVVVVPTEVTRLGHAAIAAIPFTVLEQIPATAATSKVVRQIHDEISKTVYDTVSGTARGVAGAVGLVRGRRKPR